MLVRDLKQVGMKLQKEPRAPSRRELAAKAGKMLPRKVHPTWQPYLGFDTEEQQSRQSNKEEATSTKESSKTKQPEKEKELQNIRSR